MDIFRKLFGFPNHQPRPYDSQRPENVSPFPEDYERFFNSEENDINRSRTNPYNGNQEANFNVFTDPLEMHRYFEQQMDNFLKNFGIPNFGNLFYSLEHPDVNDDQYKDNAQKEHFQNPREYFLKKGHEKPNYERLGPGEKVDKDLDGKLSVGDLDTLFNDENSKQRDIIPNEHRSVNIFGGLKPFGGTFFNQSVQVKTIRNSDGSFETRRTVTDSAGNEETTVTQKVGDKEYIVVKRRDREGKEEIHETMINMTEEEKSLFTKPNTANSFNDSFFSNFFNN